MTNPTTTPTIGRPSVGTLAERPDADFLTLSEVADILRVPVNTLRWWRQQGAGPRYFKIGRRLVTTVGDLTTWVEEQKSGTSPDAA
ncbi:MAG: helix-turn-helix domain-containing protein [Nocardioides sp.]